MRVLKNDDKAYSAYSLSSLITAAWKEMLDASESFDIMTKDSSAFVPFRLTLECEVEINPNCNAPAAIKLGVPADSMPRVTIEFPDAIDSKLEGGQ
jgi:hypothetical protein